MESNIIGRKKEKEELNRLYNSNRAEFLAVCGRRRVGKTFLIREYFKDNIVFQTAGLANASTKNQINSFYNEMLEAGLGEIKHDKPKDWLDVFMCLRKLLQSSKSKRKVVLLDELPWMDTPRSGFMSALENFWNAWGSAQSDLLLIACGSATSWMMDKLINNHGGLYNRLTSRMFLQPFTLYETEEMLTARGFHVSRYDIALLYMSIGGIPFYIDMLRPSLSIAQNIDMLFFSEGGALRTEIKNLYPSLFTNSNDYELVMEILCKHPYGLTRTELLKLTQLPSGGAFTTIIKNLEWCGFISTVKTFNAKRNATIYRVIDFYTLFYHHFIKKNDVNDWMAIQGKPVFYAWAGLTFELVVLCHVNAVKKKLGITGIQSRQYAWRSEGQEHGAQVDMVIERADNTCNLCEVKFMIGTFDFSHDYEMVLRNKISAFSRIINKKMSLQMTLITSFGLSERASKNSIVNNQITLDDLFE